jgi:hypothetical protein
MVHDQASPTIQPPKGDNMKHPLPVIILIVSAAVCSCSAAPADATVAGDAKQRMTQVESCRKSLHSVLTTKVGSMIDNSTKTRLLNDLKQPFAVGGRSGLEPSPADLASGWELFFESRRARAVDTFAVQNDQGLWRVTVTIVLDTAVNSFDSFSILYEPTTVLKGGRIKTDKADLPH